MFKTTNYGLLNLEQMCIRFGYTDCLALVCSTLSGLQEMLNMCDVFANDYNALSYASQCKLTYLRRIILTVKNIGLIVPLYHCSYVHLCERTLSIVLP